MTEKAALSLVGGGRGLGIRTEKEGKISSLFGFKIHRSNTAFKAVYIIVSVGLVAG